MSVDKCADNTITNADTKPINCSQGEGCSSHARARDRCTRTEASVWDDYGIHESCGISKDKGVGNGDVAGAASS